MYELTVTQMDTSGFESLWTTLSAGFGQTAPLLDAMYPGRGTVEGDRDAIARLRRRTQKEDPSLYCIQATLAGRPAGAAIWSVWAVPPTGKLVEDDAVEKPRETWGSEEDEDFASSLWEIYADQRISTIQKASSQSRRTWVLEWLGVVPESRGKRVGEALVCWGRDRADEAGDESITEATEAALRLYERCGYDVIDKIDFSSVGKRFPDKQLPRLTSMRRARGPQNTAEA